MGAEILNDTNEILSRLEKRTIVDPVTECWLWQGALNNVTYGHGIMKLWKGSPKFYVHRLSAHIFHLYYMGDKSLQVNHRCKNQNCWNPAHLYVGTQSENMMDRITDGSYYNPNTDKTHCIRGHEFTPENTYTWYRDDKPERQCRECNRIRQLEYTARMKARREPVQLELPFEDTNA